MRLHQAPYLLILSLLFLLLSTQAHANFQEALDAHKRGDYALAFKEYKTLADQGDALAQTMLGSMFDMGNGVAKDPQEAVRWYRLAAVQGDATGQLMLGIHYFYGKGVRQDYTEAHWWLSLSAAQGNEDAKEFMKKAAERMRARQINDRPSDRQGPMFRLPKL